MIQGKLQEICTFILGGTYFCCTVYLSIYQATSSFLHFINPKGFPIYVPQLWLFLESDSPTCDNQYSPLQEVNTNILQVNSFLHQKCQATANMTYLKYTPKQTLDHILHYLLFLSPSVSHRGWLVVLMQINHVSLQVVEDLNYQNCGHVLGLETKKQIQQHFLHLFKNQHRYLKSSSAT